MFNDGAIHAHGMPRGELLRDAWAVNGFWNLFRRSLLSLSRFSVRKLFNGPLSSGYGSELVHELFGRELLRCDWTLSCFRRMCCRILFGSIGIGVRELRCRKLLRHNGAHGCDRNLCTGSIFYYFCKCMLKLPRGYGTRKFRFVELH